MAFVFATLMAVLPQQIGVASADEPRPNIIFIMADDLGPEWIGCYGAELIETPRIDLLAKTGMRFTAAYSMPKCTPTRVTLLTGQYPFRHGWIGHWDVPRWGAGCHFDWKHNTTFARVLRQAGYATAAAGKWQINDFRVDPDCMRKHGFDESCIWTGFESGVPASAERYADPYVNTNGRSKTHKGRFGTDVFTDFLIDFIRRHKEEPFLAYFPMALPHGPLVATPAEPDAREKMDRYKAMVRYVDAAVGRLVDEVDRQGIRERTIVIFTTDNGSGGGITGRRNGRVVRGGKDKYWETGMCAPFVVNCPSRVPPGVVTGELADFTDMLPTFADLARIRLPDDMQLDGHSIAPLILGQTETGPREWILAMGAGTMSRFSDGVYSGTRRADRVIRDKRFKLWRTAGHTSAVYDLAADPAERRNLIDSDDAEAAEARERLESVLAQLPPDARPRYTPTPPQPWDRAVSGRAAQKRQRKRG